MLKVLVCGGRTFNDLVKVYSFLDEIHGKYKIDQIIDGAAQGADELASKWAKDHNVKNWRFPAKWQQHGYKAGTIRNKQMLDEGKPDVVVAFPGGKGTADMVSRSIKAGIKVIVIEYVHKTYNWPTNEEETFLPAFQ